MSYQFNMYNFSFPMLLIYSDISFQSSGNVIHAFVIQCSQKVNVFSRFLNLFQHHCSSAHSKKLNLFIHICYKLLYDADKMLHLLPEQKKVISDVFVATKDSYSLSSFIVIGSLAKSATEPKDFDFLVIGEKRKEINYQRLLRLGSINMIEKTEEEIRDDLLNSDDFLISCLLSHIVYYDNGFFWHLLQQELPLPSLSVINQRKEQLFKLEKRLKILLMDKDKDGLVEEFNLP